MEGLGASLVACPGFGHSWCGPGQRQELFDQLASSIA